jgi:hypothetical protein
MSPFILTSAIGGGESSGSRPIRFSHGENPRYPLNRRLDGPQKHSGHYGEEHKLLPLLGFETPIVHPVT